MIFFSKILFFLSSFSILPPPRQRQDQILAKIRDKKNKDVDPFVRRSLLQYECHSYYFLTWTWWVFQIFSILMLPLLLLFLGLRSFKKNSPKNLDQISLYPKVPREIREKFAPTYVRKPWGRLSRRDWPYLLKILRYGYSRPYFLFRAIWKIAVYSEIVEIFSPRQIWVTQEMVFESSLLTHYLSELGIEHTNFMHGDNYFSIQVAFSSFSKFYVWDDYYRELFHSLEVEAQAFFVFSALEKTSSSLPQKNIFKYYAQHSRSLKNFKLILNNALKFARQKNCSLVVRLHPLHKQNYEIEYLKTQGVVQEPNELDPVDSMWEAKYVCSEFSAVLYLASLLDRNIVIDNTFQERVDLLKSLDPIFLKKLPHEFLITSAETSRK